MALMHLLPVPPKYYKQVLMDENHLVLGIVVQMGFQWLGRSIDYQRRWLKPLID